MTRWITPIADGVRALGPHVDAPVFSPDGALMAFWRTRGAGEDLVVRERVYVVDVATGRELVALDGPDIVRAVAFVSDEGLLVQRDVGGGAGMRLHAVPDGGVVAEATFATGGAMETELQVTADRRAVYSAPVWRGGSRRVAEGIVCSLPELEVRTTFAPYAVAEAASELSSSAPGRSAIDPEGGRIAVFYNNSFERLGHVVIYPLGSAFATPRVLPVKLVTYDAAIHWLSRERILLGTRRGVQDFYALTLPSPPTKARGASRERWAALTAFSAFDGSLDLDAARMIALGPQSDAVKGSRGLSVLDAHTGQPLQRTPIDNADVEVHAVAWASDNTHLLTAKNERAFGVVTARTLGGALLGRLSVPFETFAADDALAVRQLSHDAVLLTRQSRAGSFRCYFLAPEALGLPRRAGAEEDRG